MSRSTKQSKAFTALAFARKASASIFGEFLPLRQPSPLMPPYFTKRIQTQHGPITFYFNLIYTVDGVRYHISGVDSDNKTYMFTMADEWGAWHLTHPESCPNWIVLLEPEFGKTILEYLAQ